jgi:hypothetical protein
MHAFLVAGSDTGLHSRNLYCEQLSRCWQGTWAHPVVVGPRKARCGTERFRVNSRLLQSPGRFRQPAGITACIAWQHV